jgi:hypothetical protein
MAYTTSATTLLMRDPSIHPIIQLSVVPIHVIPWMSFLIIHLKMLRPIEV